MKLKWTRFLLVTLTAFALISCASTPKAPAEAAIPDTLVQARKTAEDNRAKALELKADVAVKDIFGQADTAFNGAKQLQDSKAYDKATTSYTDSSALFKKAWEQATIEKNAAVKAMDTAEADKKAADQALIDAESAKKNPNDTSTGGTIK